MLQSIHDNAKGWVAYAIILLISVPFALWGIQSYLGGGNEKVVAVVNGDDIGIQAVQNEVSQQKQRILQMFGKMPPGFDDSNMRMSALDSIVNQSLLRQHADEQGYRASATEVVDVLATIPAFQKDGKFDTETYHQTMLLQKRNEAALEEQIRMSISESQFHDAISATAFLPKSEMEAYQKLISQKRDAEVYTLALADVESQINITDEMIQKHYSENPASFQTEQQLKVSYIELKESEIAKSLNPSDAELQDFYNDNADNYFSNGQFKASHIRVSFDEKQSKDEVKKKAAELHAALASGKETFEAMAKMKNLSEAGVFVELGDAIGFVPQGTMDKAFEDAVFKTTPGAIAELVETDLGYEIIKVLEITPENQKTFEQAKTEVTKDVKKEIVGKRFDELYETLRTTAFENDGSLQPAVEATEGKITTTGWFSQSSASGVIANPLVKQAAFSETVLTQGRNSALIELNDGHVMVLRLQDRKEPALKPMADVSAEIKSLLAKQEGKKQLKEKGDALLASIKEAKNWTPVGDAASSVVKHADISRDDIKLAPYVTAAIFNAVAAADKSTVYSSLTAPNGDYSIVALTSVKEGDAAVDDEAQTQYTGYIGNREQRAVMKALRDNADVQVYAERLNDE